MTTNITKYLTCGDYPTGLAATGKRNFRKRTNDFVVGEETLYYKKKTDGPLRVAIASKEDQRRAYQLHAR